MKQAADTPALNNNDVIRLLIRRQIELNALLEITQAINNNFSAASLFNMYEFVLKVHLGIKKLYLFIKEDGEWKRAAAFGYTDHLTQHVEQIKSDLDSSEYKEPYRFPDESPYMGEFELIIPVLHKSVPLAYAFVGGTGSDDENAGSNIRFIQTITNVIIVAIENKKLFREQLQQEGMKKELELASNVQSMLFPSKLPMNDKVQICADYLPHQSVGGDYYDFVQLNEDEFIYCIADVAGKGISAALLMSNFQAYLRTLALIHDNIKDLVKALNQRVYENTKGDRFITLFIGKYNQKTRQFDYVNAGHNPPILFHEGKTTFLKDGTTILGVFDDLPFIKSGTLLLRPSTLIVNYTDGIVEMDDNENGFDTEQLEEYIKQHGDVSVEEFNKKLMAYLESFKIRNKVTDDITLLSFRCS